jgi:Ca-activated chloride channel family protein
MAKIHRRIGTPIVTELELRAIELDLDHKLLSPMAAHGKLPDVYAGAPVVVLGRYRGRAPASASLELHGSSFGEPFRAVVARSAKLDESTELAASWARARIRDLEDRYAAGARELEAQIVETSRHHSVLSRFTAFLAVDRSQIANHGGTLRQIVQPVESVGASKSVRSRSGPVAAGAVGLPYGGPPAMPPGISMPAPARPLGGPPQISAASPASQARMASVARVAAPPAPKAESSRSAPPRSPSSAASESRLIDARVYLASLADLARELSALSTAQPSAMVLKLLRQRLQQWIEDLLSVGGHGALATAVAEHLQRLTVDTTAEIADELAKLAAGAVPPKPASRAFWK